MKYSMITLGAFAMMAVAQLSSLPACGQTCISNMLALAPTFGCTANDASCLCSDVNFAYGIRDCSNAACGAEAAGPVIAYGVEYCSSAGVGLSGSATGIDPGLGPATAVVASTPIATDGASAGSLSAITTSEFTSYVISGDSTVSTIVGSTTIYGPAAGSSSAITTSPIVSTVTSGDTSYPTTVGSTTIFGVAGVISTPTASASSALDSLSSSIASEASVITSSASAAVSSLSSRLSSAASPVSTTTSSAGGARQTAFAGLAAAAGFAAIIL
ncbi:uncharacterized protein L3040_001267 [Drepanopeziza brunnea f. sp. 'multigermtubi']|uniref:Effector CFEM6 n=1 Tax=Marssonina brunnea f. sp. multigermtubi (strain MB_m1) TaxID=1072389 RepID=CFM6_MARBU|nr:CFEM domain-containing protein [Drepanopeziza brunnea f. sp. 'multigermtubi' MB_m1]K1WG73.1 RecName: Full=Effector CFEM6; AltName: Full=MbCFEM6; Flags: Precursor [Drepanopeziza brunnea f. sp. 'multigermtubi' MB_m1]EKD16530.1 CFEM domain-containing protein [Drepanopeziza brunnea f. sp. 'multigermtubi' MB_m1]KAJ5051491.1 hypothetical protein L3040_001267 [Drepanopeziza brunnea f. sp. 'multigermtubi']WBR35411.1 effector protein CFEM6 [Drepanopeziza brunnea]